MLMFSYVGMVGFEAAVYMTRYNCVYKNSCFLYCILKVKEEPFLCPNAYLKKIKIFKYVRGYNNDTLSFKYLN